MRSCLSAARCSVPRRCLPVESFLVSGMFPTHVNPPHACLRPVHRMHYGQFTVWKQGDILLVSRYWSAATRHAQPCKLGLACPEEADAADGQDATVLLTDFPVALLQPIFRAMPALAHAAPAASAAGTPQ